MYYLLTKNVQGTKFISYVYKRKVFSLFACFLPLILEKNSCVLLFLEVRRTNYGVEFSSILYVFLLDEEIFQILFYVSAKVSIG